MSQRRFAIARASQRDISWPSRPSERVQGESDVAGSIHVRRLEAIGDREIQGLSDVLIDCVEGGASVSFMFP